MAVEWSTSINTKHSMEGAPKVQSVSMLHDLRPRSNLFGSQATKLHPCTSWQRTSSACHFKLPCRCAHPIIWPRFIKLFSSSIMNLYKQTQDPHEMPHLLLQQVTLSFTARTPNATEHQMQLTPPPVCTSKAYAPATKIHLRPTTSYYTNS